MDFFGQIQLETSELFPMFPGILNAGLLEEISKAKCRHAMTGKRPTHNLWPSSFWWAPIRRPHPSSHRKGNTKRVGSWDSKDAGIFCVTYVFVMLIAPNIYKNTVLPCLGSLSCCCLFQGLSPIYFSIYSGIFTQLHRATVISIQVSTKISLPRIPKSPKNYRFAMLLSTCTTTTFGAWSCLASIQSCGFGHNDCSLMWMLTFGSQKISVASNGAHRAQEETKAKDWDHWNISHDMAIACYSNFKASKKLEKTGSDAGRLFALNYNL